MIGRLIERVRLFEGDGGIIIDSTGIFNWWKKVGELGFIGSPVV